MANISIIFGTIIAADPEKYMAERIELLHYAAGKLFADKEGVTAKSVAQAYASDMLRMVPAVASLPLASPVDFSGLDKAAAMILQKKYACMVDEIAAIFPLQDSEIVKESYVSYFTEQYLQYPANAIVFVQITTLSQCYYVYPNILADVKNTTLIYTPSEIERVAGSGVSSIDFGEMVKTLAEGLLAMLPPPMDLIGAGLLAALWPGGNAVKVDWERMCKELEKIVHRELIINSFNQAFIQLAAYLDDMRVEYSARKKTQSKAELLDYLDKKDDQLKINVLAIFRHTEPLDYDMNTATLGNYMLAAGIMLSHLQEKCTLDPSATHKDLIKAWVSDLTSYVQDTKQKLINDRLSFITDVYASTETECSPVSRDCYNVTYMRYDDKYDSSYEKDKAGKSDDEKEKSRQKVNDLRNQHCANVERDLRATLKISVDAVTDLWSELAQNPIPSIDYRLNDRK